MAKNKSQMKSEQPKETVVDNIEIVKEAKTLPID